jgi:hypothetical protein
LISWKSTRRERKGVAGDHPRRKENTSPDHDTTDANPVTLKLNWRASNAIRWCCRQARVFRLMTGRRDVGSNLAERLSRNQRRTVELAPAPIFSNKLALTGGDAANLIVHFELSLDYFFLNHREIQAITHFGDARAGLRRPR